jgi:hypothetical protein
MQPFLKHVSPPDSERYTPPEIIAAVKEVLGQIDLDPATTPLVNKTFIRAKQFYTKETNGLNRENPWGGRVYINPPGGHSQPRAFWERLIIEHTSGNVSAGIFLAFTMEHLMQSQHWNYMMLRQPFCIPEKRLTFYREKNGRLEPREYTEFSSVIVYVGKNVKRFTNTFKDIGAVVIPKVISTMAPVKEDNEQGEET